MEAHGERTTKWRGAGHYRNRSYDGRGGRPPGTRADPRVCSLRPEGGPGTAATSGQESLESQEVEGTLQSSGCGPLDGRVEGRTEL